MFPPSIGYGMQIFHTRGTDLCITKRSHCSVYSGETLLLLFSKHWCIFLFTMLLCSFTWIAFVFTSCVLPLGELDVFIRSNMKPVTLWPFLYLSYRWCIFTLAYYFVPHVEDHSSHAPFIVHITNLRNNYILIWDLHMLYLTPKSWWTSLIGYDRVFFACTLYQRTFWSNSL